MNERLHDFEGKQITIHRHGLLTPVDAELIWENGENILQLSADLFFFPVTDGIKDEDAYQSAVIRGIRKWEGRYFVFGNQELTVRILLTTNKNTFDTIYIVPMVPETRNFVTKIGRKRSRETIEINYDDNRAFTVSTGSKWSTRTRKFIFISSQSKGFQDYDEIMHVAKHEFGHVLGLGDLYQSPEDQLQGVKEGLYPELDAYHIADRSYYLAMCNHRGFISNNDIEMVILAFRDNKQQLYQKQKPGDKVSDALGKGN